MIKAMIARLKQGYRTKSFPYAPPSLPENFAGMPCISPEPSEDCHWISVCPTGAISCREGRLTLDLGRCIFCRKCEQVCPKGEIKFTHHYDMAAFCREELLITADSSRTAGKRQSDSGFRKMFGRSLKIRQVSAGGCAACELDVNVLGTLAWDMGRFGLQIVASPRHADCILVTGPVTRNMLLALKKTFAAVPQPSFIIADGTCAISGGLWAGSDQVVGGFDALKDDPDLPKPSLYVPGCPHHPAVLLAGLLRLMGRFGEEP